jgi:hypothetical protein
MGPEIAFVLCTVLLASGCARGRAPAYLAMDRGAGELVTLDAELCVLARAPWTADDGPACEPVLARCAAGDGRGWLALERGLGPPPAGAEELPEVLLWCRSPDGGRTLLGSFPEARALAARRDEILVGLAAGTLVRLAPDGAIRGLAERDAPVRALAPGPEARSWWCLTGPEGSEAELALLAGDLCARWSVRTGLAAGGFAPVTLAERVWLAAGERVRAFGPGGRLEQELSLPGGPWTAALAASDGLVLLGPGAVLLCVPRGGRMQPACSQGGFRALTALGPAGNDDGDGR